MDYSVLLQCMHCGLCLSVCPTYNATKLERNSPRGRISLMRAVADGQIEMSKAFAQEMYFCLGCLACTSACPAGVKYADLFEAARAEAEESGVLNTPKRNLIRAVAIDWLFGDLARLRLLGRVIRLYQKLGLMTLVRTSGVMKIMPRRLRELEALTPKIQPKFSAELIAPVTAAVGTRRYRVAMLTGCAQDIMFSDLNRDTVEVLARNGCEVVTPHKQHCCGSLHAHNGELEQAKALARKMIDLFPPDDYDAIISNAGGCGSHLRHYGHLLADDPVYAALARKWDAKLKDIHEWLMQIGIVPPSSRNAPAQVVTYHESCHLSHGQKVVAQPRQLLRAIPNLTLVELPESNWCCGSAGIYNVIQPKMANELLERKFANIRSTGAAIIATGNPGCLAHMTAGATQRQIPWRMVHPVTLLAEAYRRG
jgi:glycolate oxidase iron-sulfur subunit